MRERIFLVEFDRVRALILFIGPFGLSGFWMGVITASPTVVR